MARFALHFTDHTEFADLQFLDTLEDAWAVFEGCRGLIDITPYDPTLPDADAAREAAYQARMNGGHRFRYA